MNPFSHKEHASPEEKVLIVVGHGAVARDTPRALVRELRELERTRQASGEPMTARELELDQRIRHWPRTADNDPYRQGVRRIADALRARIDDRTVVVAYNEFCAPGLGEAIDAAVEAGADFIEVIPTMFTPGGSHSERDIPETMAEARARHPAVTLHYVWPFDVALVAEFLHRATDR